ncbi:MAG: hypothetical protein MR210_05920 [Erysipelotrichaceae bacterium]|nr:hypothetical protein [Erysipelotrichaceae bacterium]MDY5251275.1 hypothetical protein [Erysipelotrichaceae bacterium]
MILLKGILPPNYLYILCNTIGMILFTLAIDNLLSQFLAKYLRLSKITQFFLLAIIMGILNVHIVHFLGSFVVFVNEDRSLMMVVTSFLVDLVSYVLYWLGFYSLAKAYALIDNEHSEVIEKMGMIQLDRNVYNLYLRLSFPKTSVVWNFIIVLTVCTWAINNYSAFSTLLSWLFFGFFVMVINLVGFNFIWLNYENNIGQYIIFKRYETLDKTESDDIPVYLDENRLEFALEHILTQKEHYKSEEDLNIPFRKKDIGWILVNACLILMAGMALRVFEMYYSLLIASGGALFDLSTTWLLSQVGIMTCIYLSVYLGFKGVISNNKLFGILVIAPLLVRMLGFML